MYKKWKRIHEHRLLSFASFSFYLVDARSFAHSVQEKKNMDWMTERKNQQENERMQASKREQETVNEREVLETGEKERGRIEQKSMIIQVIKRTVRTRSCLYKTYVYRVYSLGVCVYILDTYSTYSLRCWNIKWEFLKIGRQRNNKQKIIQHERLINCVCVFLNFILVLFFTKNRRKENVHHRIVIEAGWLL